MGDGLIHSLVGKTIPGFDDGSGVEQFTIIVHSVEHLPNYAAVLINGKYVMSLPMALKLSTSGLSPGEFRI